MLQWWWKWCKMQNNAVIFGGVTYFNYLDIFRIPKHGFFEKKFNFVQTIFVLSTKSTSKVHFWVNLVWKQQKIVFFAPDAWCMYWSWAILSYGLITKKTLYIYIYIYISTLTYFTLRCVFLWITMKNMMATMSINAFTLISSTHDLMTQGYEHSAGVYILQFCYFSHPGS